MGLDLSFNRIAAINAGLKLSIEPNGTDEDIAWAEQDDNVDPEYVAWLKKDIELVAVPGTDIVVENTGAGDDIVIRANQWGRVYGPITTWLKANNITCGEF